jgi:regulator of protease activity HflC (stomatin/prohibitin superfamily)
MARHEAFGHKLPLSLAAYQRMRALLARDTSPRGLRNAALLAVWYDSLLRIEDLCGLSVGLVAGKSSFRVAQGKVSIASAVSFKAEKTLTKDTVPVNVDAVLFWKVLDPKKAALDVADYQSAISWASQTALRDVIGKTMLSDMLEGRDKISSELQKIIDERTEPWGINVISVEVKDVLIPPALEDAMSMQAQAERERQARVILGDSERQVAEKFGEAAKTYANNPTAFHLRAMNMLYEGLKNNATIVIVPSTVVETMQLGTVAGLTALTKGLGDEGANKEQAAKA